MQIASSADRNLLFGIMAWQSGVVSETHLLEAMKRWTFEKHKNLSEVLVELRALTTQQVQLLDPMVEAQIHLHEGKPSSALESMNSHSGIAKTLIRHIADQDVLASINRFASRQGNNTLAKSAAEAGAEVQRYAGFRYIPQQLHAEGGLGAVYKATDSELNREVALKEIRPEFAGHAENRARFVLEAEVTGGLEHPGIVPVYGLGHYDDGRPFYAMRFIRGRSLKEAIDQFHQTSAIGSPKLRGTLGGALDESVTGTDPVKQKADEANATNGKRSGGAIGPDFSGLEFRKLLGRFIDVCQAVGYAHSRGVLHRDLKPGNIMLGKYGETLVVDWGLAKVQGRAESASVPGEMTLQPSSGSGVTPTIAGQAMGTPAYMPPEQAAGRLDQLGPASDVYSLGATLYHLLTGQTPFQSTDVNLLLNDVQNGTFAGPRSVQPAVPESLQAVCLKAMSLRPGDRYESPQDLTEDIERFLADEPVSAMRESISVRVRRWLRKHQTLTATTAAVLLVSAVSLGAFSTIMSGKNSELIAANGREREARSAAESAQKLAEMNEQSAREQSQLALATLTSVVNDVQGGLLHVPGGGDVRRRLLTASLEKLEAVSTKFLSQASVDRSTWRALTDMGDIILDFGVEKLNGDQILMTSPIHNDMAEEQQPAASLALSFYQRAFDIAKSLSDANSGDIESCHRLTTSFTKLGNLALRQGNLTEAERLFGESLSIAQNLAKADAENIEWQSVLSNSNRMLGHLAMLQGRFPEAQRFLDESLHINARLADKVSAIPEWQLKRERAITFSMLGDLAMSQGNLTEAQRLFDKSHAIHEQLAKDAPYFPEWQRDLTVSFNNLGHLATAQGNLQEAQRLFGESLRIAKELADSEPSNAQVQHGLGNAYNNLGDLATAEGNLQEAQRLFGESLRIAQNLAKADPTDAQWQRDLAISYYKIGEVAKGQDNFSEAIEAYENGIVELRKLMDKKVDRGQIKQLLEACEQAKRICFTNVALGDWNTILQHSGEQLLRYLDARAYHCCKRGRFVDAEQAATMLSEMTDADSGQLYNVACVFSLCAAAIISPNGELLPAKDAVRRQKLLQESLSALRRSIDKGWTDFAQLQQDTDLEPLRELQEFSLLLPPENVTANQDTVDMSTLASGDLLVRFDNSLLADSSPPVDSHDVTFEFGRHGTALRLSDEGFVAHQAGALIGPETHSVAFWFKPGISAVGQRNHVFLEYGQEFNNGIQIVLDMVPNLRCIQWGDDPSTAQVETNIERDVASLLASPNSKWWYHVAVTWNFDSAEMSLFVDGEQVDHISDAVNVRLKSDDLLFLGNCRTKDAPCNALIDDLWVSKTVLTENHPFLINIRGLQNCRHGKFGSAEISADQLIARPDVSAGQLYSAACIFSLCSTAASSERYANQSPDRTLKRTALLTKAIATLKRANDTGWNNLELLQKNPDLAPLRELPEFKALLQTNIPSPAKQ